MKWMTIRVLLSILMLFFFNITAQAQAGKSPTRQKMNSALKFSQAHSDSSYHEGRSERVLDLGRIYLPEYPAGVHMDVGEPLPLSDEAIEQEIDRARIQDTLKRLDRLSRRRQARQSATIRRRCI